MSFPEKVEKHLAVLEDDEREFHVAFRKYLNNYYWGFGRYGTKKEHESGLYHRPTSHTDTEEMVFCHCFGKASHQMPGALSGRKHDCIKKTLEFINEPQWKYNNYVQDLKNKILAYSL